MTSCRTPLLPTAATTAPVQQQRCPRRPIPPVL
ncbi:hypothetical protein H4696_001525 [Amycolatopsis lexingtonensis]|uniref:Uncharacterized protein n=1 Tax=Amycolatopsis lexingtonensis TaxID=218822 RepID=A0ABR9HU35_9PSEU|nr:hypothetical protein [Amycolatopsis lexingtonensis]